MLTAALLCAACEASTPRRGPVPAPLADPHEPAAHEAQHIGMTAHATADVATPDSAIERIRKATAAFHDLDAAVRAGYPATVAACVAHPQHGAMGFHHMNRDLLDGRIELERPEILLYSRAADGRYVLNGVEYIVPYSVHPANAAPPTVLGQSLKRADGLQLWYLHVWVWTENPQGMFADWNPAVSCAPAKAALPPARGRLASATTMARGGA